MTAPRPAGHVAATAPGGRIRNAMTVDVEDYFQVQAFAHCIPRVAWDGFSCRVEHNTDRILQQFDRAGTKATFFTLGWVAERYPAMVRRIVEQGHELASHGWEHIRVFTQSADAFRADIRKTKLLLEDIGGVAVTGYRAATFSIGKRTPWAFEVLESEGYRYSSSIYPVRHDLYGMPDAPRTPFHPGSGSLWEIPMTTVRLGSRNIPCSGGGYFRLLPYALYRFLLARLNSGENRPGIFYFHPWEIDPDQPRIQDCGARSRFRHYNNLAKTAPRLDRLLRDFVWDRMDRVFADILANPTAAGATAPDQGRAQLAAE